MELNIRLCRIVRTGPGVGFPFVSPDCSTAIICCSGAGPHSSVGKQLITIFYRKGLYIIKE